MSEMKPVPGYCGDYIATRGGRVISMKSGTPRELKTPVKPKGYPQVNLSLDGDVTNYDLHRVIARTFLGEPEDGMEVRHLDGDPMNNAVSNLKYGTRKENVHDRKRHGTDNAGERSGHAVLTTDQAFEIRELYATGEYTYHELEEMFPASYRTIADVVNGVTWKSVGGPIKGEDY
jgi:hypothetical protein